MHRSEKIRLQEAVKFTTTVHNTGALLLAQNLLLTFIGFKAVRSAILAFRVQDDLCKQNNADVRTASRFNQKISGIVFSQLKKKWGQKKETL